MRVVQQYTDDQQNIHAKSDELLALPISDGLYNLARFAIKEHDIPAKWSEFLFHLSANNNTYISLSTLTSQWRKWVSRAGLYSKLSLGKVRYNHLSSSKPDIKLVTDCFTPNVAGISENEKKLVANKMLSNYTRKQLIAMGYNPDTGFRKEWENTQ